MVTTKKPTNPVLDEIVSAGRGSAAKSGITAKAPAGEGHKVASNSRNTEDQSLEKRIREMLRDIDLMTAGDQTRENAQEEVPALSYEALLKKGILTQADIFNADPDDKKVAETPVIEQTETDGRKNYYVGMELTQFLLKHPSNGSARSNSKPDAPDRYRVTNIGEIQREMYEGILLASRMTGVPAKLLGAMAGKESGFGKNQVSHSGAEGLFQQTDGYLIANYVNNPAQARRIAAVVPEAAEYMKDGKMSLAEARKLAWNPAAAAMMTALRADALAQSLGVNLNNSSTWALVYTEHNAGRGSLNKLLKGGMTDEWIQKLNPSMYKNARTAEDVIAIAAKDMQVWGNRFEKMATTIVPDGSYALAQATIAKAQNSSREGLKAPEPA